MSFIKGDERRESYIIRETGTDWDGNKIAVIGRFDVGDQVRVSKEYRNSIKKSYPEIAAQLAGVQTIQAIHSQLRPFPTPPRYWTGGLAMYVVKGCSFLISDADLTKATPEDARTDILIQINHAIHNKFPDQYEALQPVLQMEVWKELNDSAAPFNIDAAMERVIARKFGVEV